jgi:mono/diheme cytochrome c family protein
VRHHRRLRISREFGAFGTATIALVSRVVRIIGPLAARVASAVVAAAIIVAPLAVTGDGRAGVEARGSLSATSAGSPDRGRAVYLSKGCAGCHAQTSPTAPSVGPLLTADLLRSSAAGAGKPVGPFVAESLLLPNAFVSPGYVSNLMRPTTGLSKQQLDDLAVRKADDKAVLDIGPQHQTLWYEIEVK